MLDDLKNFNAERMDLTELVALASFADSVVAKSQELSVELPEWVTENTKSLHREIKSKNQDRLAMKLKNAKARLETLKTPDEKRKATEDEIAKLTQQLATS